MPDIFDEVNEELRAERARRLLQRYGALLIVAAVLVVAGVGAWQWWRWHEQQGREAVASTFLQAMTDTAGTATSANAADRAKGEQAFAELAASGPEGYRTLARLRLAALKAAGGDVPGALALWQQVSADDSADPTLRQLADLLWVQRQVDTADPTLLDSRLASLLAPTSPWRPLALELEAWVKLRVGDKPEAAKMLREILSLPSAPGGVRQRAGSLLQFLGENPASVVPGMGQSG